MLLIGQDWEDEYHGYNTDVLIVAALNKDTKTISLLSIPRDLWVYIPTYGWNRINTAHVVGVNHNYPGGGPGLLKETIRYNLGISIDNWVHVDLEGFQRVVDAMGGVTITVACPINLRFKPPTAEDEDQEERLLLPGVYEMDGETALLYVRTRRNVSDFDQSRRQQQFLKAMFVKAKSIGIDIPVIRELWSALKDAYETDLGLGDVISLAPIALRIDPENMRTSSIGPKQTTDWVTAAGAMVLLPDYAKIQKVVEGLYAPPSAIYRLIAEEGARIQVRNGTYRQQLALIGADQLRWQGLKIMDTGLADRPNYQRSTIVVYNDKPQTLAILRQTLGVSEEAIQVYAQGIGLPAPDPELAPDILVILGEDYDPCPR